MSRIDFMSELRTLLMDISEEEREEAMQYYNDYFEDAGIEHEMDVIRELGSPQKVAAIIKAGLDPANEDSSEYRETGYADTRFEKNEVPAPQKAYDDKEVCKQGKIASTSRTPKLSLVIAMICAIAFLSTGAGMAYVGSMLTAAGIVQLFYSVPEALALLGIGLLLFAIGISTVALMWKQLAKVTPPIFKWFVGLGTQFIGKIRRGMR